MQCHLDHFSEVKRAPVRRLSDLFAATEAIGDHERVFGLRPHSRQEDTLATLHRYVVMFLLHTIVVSFYCPLNEHFVPGKSEHVMVAVIISLPSNSIVKWNAEAAGSVLVILCSGAEVE